MYRLIAGKIYKLWLLGQDKKLSNINLSYNTILTDVCIKFNIPIKDNISTESLEKNIIIKIFEDSLNRIEKLGRQSYDDFGYMVAILNIDRSNFSLKILKENFYQEMDQGGQKALQLITIFLEALSRNIDMGSSNEYFGEVFALRHKYFTFARVVEWTFKEYLNYAKFLGATYEILFQIILKIIYMHHKGRYLCDDFNLIPQFVKLKELKVEGIEIDSLYEWNMNIIEPLLLRESYITKRMVSEKLSEDDNQIFYGVYYNHHHNNFKFLIGSEVDNFAYTIPTNKHIELHSSEYAVFDIKEVSTAFNKEDLRNYIFHQWLPKSGYVNNDKLYFEKLIYTNNNEKEVYIYIPIKTTNVD